jgi:hypothetical protein
VQEFYSNLSQILQAELGCKPENILSCIPNTGEFLRWSDKPNKTNLFLIIQSWDFKGKTYYKAYYGDWKTGGEFQIYKSYSQLESTSAAFKKYEKAADQDAKEATARKKKLLYAENFAKHNAKWVKATPRQHWYLDKKQINSFCSKVYGDTLYIPTYNRELNLHGFQVIYKDQDGSEKKIFPKGLSPQGQFCHLKDFSKAKVIYLVEGFGTGASLQMSINEPVVVGFGTPNIPKAAESIRSINPGAKIGLAVDNDNAGFETARKTQKLVSNTVIVTPENYNDWNDLMIAEGKKAVYEQSRFQQEKTENKVELKYLGFDDQKYYVYSDLTKQIAGLKPDHIKPPFIYRLVPSQQYWIDLYYKDGNKLDLEALQSDVMNRCHQVGVYNPDNIHGQGFWWDKKQIVINTGKKVIGQPENSKIHYQPSPRDELIFGDEKNNTMQYVWDIFSSLNFRNENDFLYLTAWYVQGMCFGLLKWKMTAWLLGEQGSGKSTCLEWLRDWLGNSYFTRNASRAGLTQKFKADQVPIIHDEFEPQRDLQGRAAGFSSERYKVIELARASSSDQADAGELKGTPSGNANTYKPNFTFIFGSVAQPKLEAQDRSRIISIEKLPETNQTDEQFDVIEEKSEKIAATFPENLAYCKNRIELILKVQKKCSNRLSKLGFTKRQAATLSVVLGCNYVYFGSEYSDELFEKLYQLHDFESSEYLQSNEDSTAKVVLNDLFEIIIAKAHGETTTIGLLIKEYIEYSQATVWPTAMTKKSYEKNLAAYGLRLDVSSRRIYITNSNQNRDKSLSGHGQLTLHLAREKSLNPQRPVKPVSIGGVSTRGIWVNLPE